MGVHVKIEVYFLLSVKVSGKKAPQAGNAVKNKCQSIFINQYFFI